jgi:hypothetical protein
MNRLGCLTPFGIGAGVIAIIAVVGAFLLSGGAMFSPGPLSAYSRAGVVLGGVSSHAALGGNCGACHSSPWDARGMAGACLACHSDVQAELTNRNTLHGAMPNNMACLSCHGEHKGESVSLTKAALTSFPHDQVGFSLGTHKLTASKVAFVCEDCHTGLKQSPRPAGVYKLVSADCIGCHVDYQATFMATHREDFGDDCMSCHDGVDRYSRFSHATLSFQLEGKHANVSCGLCHTNARIPAHFKIPDSTCLACHRKDDTHKGEFGTDCAACHTASGWKLVTFDHAKTNFPLTGAHVKTTCAKCHTDHVYKGTPTACVSCHADPQVHKGQFGTDCAACHVTSSWKNVIFKHSFPINHGSRRPSSCATCHTDPPPNQYKTYTCYGCHAHSQGQIVAEHRGIPNLNDCMRCHPYGR